MLMALFSKIEVVCNFYYFDAITIFPVWVAIDLIKNWILRILVE